MKNIFKKMVVMIIAVCTVITSAQWGNVEAKADSVTTIPVGQDYKVTVPKSGSVDLTFTSTNAMDYYNITVIRPGDGKGSVKYKLYDNSYFSNPFADRSVYNGDSETYDFGKTENAPKSYYIRIEGNSNSAVDAYVRVNKYSTDDYVDDPSQATAINVGSEVNGIANHYGEYDCFKFTVDSTDSYYKFDATLTSDKPNVQNGDCIFYFYDNPYMANDFKSIYIGVNSSTNYDFAKYFKPGNTYYIKVVSYKDDSKYTDNKYKFKITKYGTDDYVDDVSKPTALTVNADYKTGYLNHDTDEDYFTFTTGSKKAFYELQSKVPTGVDGYIEISLYSDSEMTVTVNNYYVYDGDSRAFDLGNTLKANTKYYIRVSGRLNLDYEKLQYYLKVASVNDDVDDTSDKATSIAINKTYTYKIQNGDDVDVFKVKTGNFVTYSMNAKALTKSSSLTIKVFSDKELTKLVKIWYVYGVGSISEGSAIIDDLVPGRTYYITVSGSKDAKYSLGISAKAPSHSVVAAKSKITLSWNKIKKASGYVIERKLGSGKYSQVKNITSGKTTKWVDKKVKKGKKYTYRMRAYIKKGGKTYYSGYSAAKTIKAK